MPSEAGYSIFNILGKPMENIFKKLLNSVSVLLIIFMLVMGFLGDIISESLGIPVAQTIIGFMVLGIPLSILSLVLYSKSKK